MEKLPLSYFSWIVSFQKQKHFDTLSGDKYLENFEMWCWRRMEKISWTDRVKNKDVLHRVKEERNILHTIKRRKANWIGHDWSHLA
jgi:uroporphyrinogen-III decarboxylase